MSLEKAIELTADLAESPENHVFVAHQVRDGKPRFGSTKWPRLEITKATSGSAMSVVDMGMKAKVALPRNQLWSRSKSYAAIS
jgi:hypothetical protein